MRRYLPATLLFLPICTGCPATQSLPSQAPVMEMIEKRTEARYLLYVPSIYSESRQWPLVVACHGTIPYDTADFEMREWAKFAENNGIIVAAPRLASSKGDFPPPPETQHRLQDQDEQRILAVIAELKRRYHIAEEMVFLTGWSAASYPILHTGLRNPDIIRAMFIRQGSFDERFMDVNEDALDPRQPIKVLYGKSDFLRDQTKASIRWLQERGLSVEEEEIAAIHQRLDARLAWKFFKNVAGKRPWLRIRHMRVDSAEPLKVRFELDAIPDAKEQKWFFGDGQESYERSPVHAYDEPGRYEVNVNVEVKGGKVYRSSRVIRVARTIGEPD